MQSSRRTVRIRKRARRMHGKPKNRTSRTRNHRHSKPRRIRWMHEKPQKTPSQSVKTDARALQEHSSSVETEPRAPQELSRSIQTDTTALPQHRKALSRFWTPNKCCFVVRDKIEREGKTSGRRERVKRDKIDMRER